MKAALFKGVAELQLRELSKPEINDNELLIKIKASSICGTDKRIFKNGHFKIPTNTERVLGHELSGEVYAVGKNVSKLKVGDRVTVAPNVGCGQCHMCLQGFNQLCPQYEAFGISMDGGFAEYMKVPAKAIGNVVSIPDHISFEEAALIEPFSCAYRAYSAHDTKPGDTVLVIGPGPIGAMHVMLNKLAGARVIVAGTRDARLEEIKKHGADVIINSKKVDLKEAIMDLTNGNGVDVVITAVSSPEVQTQALELSGYRGRISLFGGLPKGKEMVQLDTNLIHYKEMIVTGTTGSTIDDFYQSIKLLSDRHINLMPLISATYSLDQTLVAFNHALSGEGMKTVIVNS
ncbi:zinc-dependent dehydrogenase [Bacillus sp. AFS055030]|uniref:zinc-dependent dehydrogenase n=1 Tax=Bacillus sp. AFS055030 TaxID=2033507 RepID=UPI000BFE7B81|nr:zinc-dependent dehydrogenase [Bacillus sp. AFS055030]PGL70998.1 alcohol dehydrogenase [Bacillus sp. AFS055030]